MFFRSAKGDFIVWLGPRCLATFSRSAQTAPAVAERGGQLFGDFDGALVRVRLATPAGPQSRQSRTSLTVDREHERHEIDVMFRRGLHFVGSWHTHPERVPSPSGLDIATITDQFRRSKHELRRMVAVIVGTSSDPAGLWVGAASGRRVEPLRHWPDMDTL